MSRGALMLRRRAPASSCRTSPCATCSVLSYWRVARASHSAPRSSCSPARRRRCGSACRRRGWRASRGAPTTRPSELTPSTQGYVAVFGCVRHDLAVATTADGRTYALGGSVSRGQRRRSRVHAAVPRATTATRAGRPRRSTRSSRTTTRSQTPSAASTRRRWRRRRCRRSSKGSSATAPARRRWRATPPAQLQLDLARQRRYWPKGGIPASCGWRCVTAAAGLHGYALIAVVWLWSRRRARRAAARGQFSDAENDFYDDDSIG